MGSASLVLSEGDLLWGDIPLPTQRHCRSLGLRGMGGPRAPGWGMVGVTEALGLRKGRSKI